MSWGCGWASPSYWPKRLLVGEERLDWSVHRGVESEHDLWHDICSILGRLQLARVILLESNNPIAVVVLLHPQCVKEGHEEFGQKGRDGL